MRPEEMSEWLKARARRRRARRTAEICGKCGRTLDEQEPVYVTRVKLIPTRTTRWLAPVCEGCAPDYMKDTNGSHYYVQRLTKIFPSRPCESCGRTVVFDTTPALWRRRKHVHCSSRCQDTYYRRARRAGRA
jgi:hypothetical protein